MTFSMSVFPQTMSRRRCDAITDKLMILRPVFDFILKKCHTLYVPLRNLSINEGMLKWKGRLSIRIYNPMKPIKYGIKFYFLCEAKTRYVLDCLIYQGVTSTLRDIVLIYWAVILGMDITSLWITFTIQ